MFAKWPIAEQDVGRVSAAKKAFRGGKNNRDRKGRRFSHSGRQIRRLAVSVSCVDVRIQQKSGSCDSITYDVYNVVGYLASCLSPTFCKWKNGDMSIVPTESSAFLAFLAFLSFLAFLAETGNVLHVMRQAIRRSDKPPRGGAADDLRCDCRLQPRSIPSAGGPRCGMPCFGANRTGVLSSGPQHTTGRTLTHGRFFGSRLWTAAAR